MLVLLMLAESFERLKQLLLIMDHFQVVIFKSLENFFEIVGILEVKIIAVEIIGNIDQAQIKKLLESIFPLIGCDLRMHLGPVAHVFPFCLSTRLVHETEATADLLVDLFIILVDDIIVKLGVLHMPLDPSSLDLQVLAILRFITIVTERLGTQ